MMLPDRSNISQRSFSESGFAIARQCRQNGVSSRSVAV